MNTVAWFIPGVVLSAVVSVIIAPSVARILRSSAPIGGLLTLSIGVVLSATVTPIPSGPETANLAMRACDFSRIGLAPLRDLLEVNDTSLNVVLFMPLGAAVGLVCDRSWKLVLLIAAIGLPFAVEAIQLAAPVLARGCESADVVDNLTGLTVGFVVTSIISRLGRPTRLDGQER